MERTLDVEILDSIIYSTLPLTTGVAMASHITQAFQLFSGDELDIAIHTLQGCYEHQIMCEGHEWRGHTINFTNPGSKCKHWNYHNPSSGILVLYPKVQM